MSKLLQPLLRKLALPLAYYLGLDRWLRNRSKHNYLILCYHGVDKRTSLPYTGRHIAAEVFERHLQYFLRNFQVVSLPEIFRMKQEGIVAERPTIALTFDDGYENNYSVALPLLQKYKMPASFYVSGVCVEEPDFVIWADILDVIWVHRGDKGIQFEEYDFRPGPKGLWDKHKQLLIYDFIKRLPLGKRDEVLAQLREQYEFDRLVEEHDIRYFQLMNQTQIQACADSGLIEIGVHGYKHYNLAYIKPEEAQTEIETAHKLLQACCMTEINSIAFPDGNYDERVKEISRSAGLCYLLAENYLLAGEEQEPDILPRVSISGTTNYFSQILFINKQFRSLGF